MKKEELKKHIDGYTVYAIEKSPFCAPTKGVNSGAVGNLTELILKYARGYAPRKYFIAPAGRQDTSITIDGRRYRLEIKTGAGELATCDNAGYFTGLCTGIIDFTTNKPIVDHTASGYILYFPWARESYDKMVASGDPMDLLHDGYFLTIHDFIFSLQYIGLLRVRPHVGRTPRIAIQEYRSEKKKKALMDILEPYRISW